ncbi:MAG: T9SS type A sorting domain-containing protein [Parafilimonas sp.]|nr:T9SS type A sorting domain-containing protein [Parafilimonas sp.]
MKKIFTLFGVVILIASVKAQKLSGFRTTTVKHPLILSANKPLSPDAACDTVNLAAANNWQAYYYTYGTDGYVFGTSNNKSNGYDIIEDANFYDLSSYGYNYISGGLAYFAKANSTDAADLDKDMIFRVYEFNDIDSIAGPLLGSTTVKLSQIHSDVQNDFLTEFKFATPVALPASKKILVSIDHSKFKWSGSVKDSVAIVANGDEDSNAAALQNFEILGGGGNVWLPVDQVWSTNNGTNPLQVNLYLFPYVSNASDGCGLLPVSIINFGGTVKDFSAYLNWSTAGESNNKGFYIERSKDGQNFTSIGFVNGAGNSNKITNYNYTDATLKDLNVSTTYYRLKQVDVDGKSAYSKVLPLNTKNNFVWRVYPNPVKDVATVEVNLGVASKVSVQVIARDGRIVMNSDKGILPQGTQQVFVNTQSLAKGSYFVRLTIADKTYTTAFVKE